MQWRGRRQSENVEDRRGFAARRPVVAGGGGLLIIVALVFALCGRDPSDLLRMLEETGQIPPSADIGTGGSPYPGEVPQGPGSPRPPRPDDELAEFASVVLADTEDVWSRIFRAGGEVYRPPRLVLFSDAVDSACGFGSAAVGPFYCPGDQQVYIDLSFFADLSDQFGAPGDFAQAYVVAHEIGHHVQNLLGLSDQVQQAQSRARDQREVNALGVRMELQADCFAGIWGHHAAMDRTFLEEGDIEEGLRAAAAIGDDRIQRRSTGHVSPESWTHGSSAQRSRWFRQGLQAGRIEGCDTFAADPL